MTPLSLPQREHKSIAEVGLLRPADKTATAMKNIVLKTPFMFQLKVDH